MKTIDTVIEKMQKSTDKAAKIIDTLDYKNSAAYAIAVAIVATKIYDEIKDLTE